MMPLTALIAAGSPAAMAVRRSGTEAVGSPTPVAAPPTFLASVESILPLTMASMIAEPKAPPIARAEKASPVAVERYAWGAVNWVRATRRVSGPDWPMPAMRALQHRH